MLKSRRGILYKDGNPAGKSLQDLKRDLPFPIIYTQIDGIDMQVMIPYEKSITLRLVNSMNKSESTTLTIKNYTQDKDFSVSADLSTSSGIYRIVCK